MGAHIPSLVSAVVFLGLALTAALTQGAKPTDPATAPVKPTSHPWGYAATDDVIGPFSWSKVSEECGTQARDERQSPIDIKVGDVKRSCSLKDLKLKYSDVEAHKLTIQNNGHSVQVSVPEKGTEFLLSGGPLGNNTYELRQFHFHWGHNDSEGSEHLINGHSQPLELHLVHKNKKYGNMSEAMKENDGVAVVAVLFKIGKGLNPELGKVVRQITDDVAARPGEAKTISENVFMSHLVSESVFQGYYTYVGSLASPPCHEGIRYIVLREPMWISAKEMELFRRVRGPNNRPMAPNHRPVQPINGRLVESNQCDEAEEVTAAPEVGTDRDTSVHVDNPGSDLRNITNATAPQAGEMTNLYTWSVYYASTECNATCGGGKQQFVRHCLRGECQGDSLIWRDCGMDHCPINGGWGEWTTAGGCSSKCGGGLQTVVRHCNNPVPSYGGLPCSGESERTEECNKQACPVDGGWSAWVAGNCSAHCGGGQMTWTRTCTNPSPKGGGKPCDGVESKATPCNDKPCPVHGGWSNWIDSDRPCSRECGGGHRLQYRTCTNPAPKHGGLSCSGESRNRVPCNEFPCEIRICNPVVGYVDQGQPDENVLTPTHDVADVEVSKYPGYFHRDLYFRFPLPGNLTADMVESARVNMFMIRGNPIAVRAYSIFEEFDPKRISYENRPRDRVPIFWDRTGIESFQNKPADVTEIVKTLLKDNVYHFSLHLTTTSSEGYARFTTKGVGDWAPCLKIPLTKGSVSLPSQTVTGNHTAPLERSAPKKGPVPAVKAPHAKLGKANRVNTEAGAQSSSSSGGSDGEESISHASSPVQRASAIPPSTKTRGPPSEVRPPTGQIRPIGKKSAPTESKTPAKTN